MVAAHAMIVRAARMSLSNARRSGERGICGALRRSRLLRVVESNERGWWSLGRERRFNRVGRWRHNRPGRLGASATLEGVITTTAALSAADERGARASGTATFCWGGKVSQKLPVRPGAARRIGPKAGGRMFGAT